MSETATEPIQETGRPEIVIDGSKFWGTPETAAAAAKSAEQTKPLETTATNETKPPVTEQTQETPTTTAAEEEEIIDLSEWLKREFDGIDDINAIKAEREEFKKLKSQKPEELKFENDESRIIYEHLSKGEKKKALEILNRQEQLEQVVATEVTKDNAEDIIKLQMQLGNKLLTKSDINFQFKELYTAPKEPTQRATEPDEEFAERHSEWQEKVSNIEQRKIVAAKMAIPELEKLKAQIVLPEISKPQEQPKQQTQEELDAAKRLADAYNLSVDNSIKNFNGVSIPVKNEVVDYTVSFGTTDEEKAALTNIMKGFASENYDTNFLFANMWIDDNNSLKVGQMIADYHFLKNKDKILAKIANDSATQAIDQYIKEKKQINLNDVSNPHKTVEIVEEKSEMDKIRDKIYG